MTPLSVGFIGLATIFVLLALRTPIGLALIGVCFIGTWTIIGLTPALSMLRIMPYEFVAHWSLSAIPMFLLMGAISYHAGLVSTLYRAARLWFWFVPGNLAIASNFACAGFAAASGSSVATATAMGRLTIPEMLRCRYDPGLATGVVAAAGTLGSLIPPSILLILYGLFTEQSISALLMAGVLPGILTAVVYAVMIIIRVRHNPSLAPPMEGHINRAEKWEALRGAWPIPLLILGVIGGIYSGILTATEAGAAGAFLAFLIGVARGQMTRAVLDESVREALASTAFIFFIAIGASLLAKFMVLSGIPTYLGQLTVQWFDGPLGLLMAAFVIFLVLGMFLDPIGLMLLSIPVLLPMFKQAGFDLVWFGILVIKFVEIGLITPPVGLNIYAIKSVTGDAVPLETIFKGAAWFLLCEFIVVALLVVFPDIALLLPRMMR
ncbi:MAG: TRAP transporter large permease [Proteobacteria bacterium]|nr:MAG: TRAP transporter large permease [Pseudomonadota bacterium]QKK12353.1 MAG: TRAP transporter large permease [Pseudomonadota bacterium]